MALSGVETTFSAHGSPSDWRNKPVSTGYHHLRQDFSPPKSSCANDAGNQQGGIIPAARRWLPRFIL